MSEHPIQGLMKTALESLQEMTDVNTIIGDPIETPDGNVILTVSKVGFGFAAGGSEFNPSDQGSGSDQSSGEESDSGSGLPFGGGSGGGVSITPIAFLIVGPSGIRTIHLDNSTHLYEKLLDLAPQAVDKIQSMIMKRSGQRQGQGQDSQSKESHKPSRGIIRQRKSQSEQQDNTFE
ncbi:sporulation protein YtfJ [Scopulibacillus darangshiensis]|uniref:Sporulation protein YtfJ n=1 Tax=Scopulibacillus darangshiensis TaxID=442528 RepID=A0A4R2PAS5_9BACL|nr:GerW family sporulation protein [Scopulibacillus darangshiensis]TCP32057.1 sporulation protein YtfJ [Scopulibacillus darangshiensis]